jgi:lambda repressor-like predicted transcriptional regulator
MKPTTTLKRVIFESGQTQRTIAAAAGLREDQLSRIVNGLHCDAATQQAIADQLGKTVHELWPPAVASTL